MPLSRSRDPATICEDRKGKSHGQNGGSIEEDEMYEKTKRD